MASKSDQPDNLDVSSLLGSYVEQHQLRAGKDAPTSGDSKTSLQRSITDTIMEMSRFDPRGDNGDGSCASDGCTEPTYYSTYGQAYDSNLYRGEDGIAHTRWCKFHCGSTRAEHVKRLGGALNRQAGASRDKRLNFQRTRETEVQKLFGLWLKDVVI